MSRLIEKKSIENDESARWILSILKWIILAMGNIPLSYAMFRYALSPSIKSMSE